MTVRELKKQKDYEFECNISKREVEKECKKYGCFEEWGCAFIWLNDRIGVEYNLCIDDGENCSAIYKMECFDDCAETDYNTFIHYEIDFDDRKWKKSLENAMCEALIEFFKL